MANKMKEKEYQDVFWADQLASEATACAQEKGIQVTCRSGASPSGAKHIGNLFDVLKSYIVFKAVRKKDYPARFVLTHDDRDPLRTIPPRIPTLEANWVSTKDMGFEKHLGEPYYLIPDPFDCHNTWAEHFSKVWENGIFATGVLEKDVEIHSNNALYGQGKFDPYILALLENIEKTRSIISKFQETKVGNYIPFDAICQECGKITTKAIDFDLANRTVKYICDVKALAGKYVVKGCGHKGDVGFREGKLPWRFEWPAQWGIFETNFEPFGKEHAEGSWPSGQVIARELYHVEPPIPLIYEFLLINGKKMSSRYGNVYLAQEILDIIEPEVFMYFYTKRSQKQRNLDLKNIHLLVEDFEHAERVYFGTDQETNEKDKINFTREYESSIRVTPKEMPVRIPYQFAAVVAQLSNDMEHAIQILKSTDHITKKELTAEHKDHIWRRLNLAKNWVEKFSNESRIKLNEQVSDEIKRKLNDKQKAALRTLAEKLKGEIKQTDLYNNFFEISKEFDLKTSDFFKSAYQVLISKDSGPRLAPFIIALGKDRVRGILEQL